MTDPQSNRRRLLDAATELFAEHGYQQTPVQAIIDHVGVAKGTFYHYFKSKDALLDAAMDRIADQIMREIQPVLEDDEIGALGKLYHFMELGSAWKVRNSRTMRWIAGVMYKEQNFALRHRLMRVGHRFSAPTLTRIMREGMDEGVFDITHPEQTAELLFQFGGGLMESIAPWVNKLETDPTAIENIRVYNDLYFTFVARLLGVPDEMIRTSNNVVDALFGEPEAP